MRVAAIILAAGASRRLGRAKQLVEYRGETLLARAVRVVREAGIASVVVVLGAEFEAIEKAVDLSGVSVVRNSSWAQGIASSIHAGLVEAKKFEPEGMLIMTCDQPRLTAAHLQRLVETFRQETIVASEYAGARGTPAIFPRAAFARLLSLSGDTGARALLKDPPCTVATVNFPGGEIDVDFPADIAKLD